MRDCCKIPLPLRPALVPSQVLTLFSLQGKPVSMYQNIFAQSKLSRKRGHVFTCAEFRDWSYCMPYNNSQWIHRYKLSRTSWWRGTMDVGSVLTVLTLQTVSPTHLDHFLPLPSGLKHSLPCTFSFFYANEILRWTSRAMKSTCSFERSSAQVDPTHSRKSHSTSRVTC